MNEEQFKQRTKQLAIRIIKLAEALPNTLSAQVIGKQLLRSGTSVGANYRAACRGRSLADVISKFWMELLIEANLVSEMRLKELIAETNEILAMTVASLKTLKAKAHLAIQNPKSKI